MQTINLSDQLEIEHWPTLRVVCDSPELSGESNLVWKAADLRWPAAVASSLKRQLSVSSKRIPVAMGLGGGSSDAAAALCALNELWELSEAHR